jgi:hypothetical protein
MSTIASGSVEIAGAVSFGHKLAGSEAFKSLFKEGMYLVELSAAYLDGPGRLESKALPRATALAYASESLVCAVKDYYKESPLQLSTLSIPAALNSVCNMSALPSALCHVGMAGSSSADLSDLELFHSNGVSERFVRKCKLRYSKRTFLTEVHAHPVILLVRPG